MHKKEAPAGLGGGSSQAYETLYSLAAQVARLGEIGSVQPEVATSVAPLPALMRLVASRPEDLTSAFGPMIAMPAGEDLLAELCQLATHDALTGLYNRREMNRLLAEEIVRGRRYQRPVSLLLIDLDRFKEVNDTFGHPAGDLVLQAVSATICESVRSLDRVARYGGEELAVILPETSQAQAVMVAERIRTRVAQRAVELNQSDPEAHLGSVTVTISIGVGCSTALPEISAERLLRSAEQALHAAKRAGRNRSMTAKFRS